MVNIAGRSKACHTCRRRKIRCGSEKPSCNNCLKSGRSCAGYQRNQPFILSHYAHLPITEGSALRTAYGAATVPSDLSQCQPVKRPSYQKQYQGLSIALPKPVSARNTTRDQFLALFIDCQLPSSILTQGQHNDHRKWLLRLPDIRRLSPALEHAILAVSTAALKKSGKFGGRTNQSLALYTRGLCELQRAIDNPKTQLDDQTLAACVLLGMFEVLEYPGRTVSGYMRHYQGAMTLLHLRGPGQHIGGLAHDVFQVLRMHTAFQALAPGQSHPLARGSWMEKPWSTKSKTMHDQLLDIFLQIPQLLAKTRKVLSSQHFWDSVTGIRTLSAFLALNEKLDQWFINYQSTYPILYSPRLSNLSSSTDVMELGKTFPVSFQFVSYHVGETMVLFWTVQVLLHASICSLDSKLSSIGETTLFEGFGTDTSIKDLQRKILESGIMNWMETSAHYICQSVEYFFDQKFCGIGLGVVLPPLLVVKACITNSVRDTSREIAWIDEMVGHIQGNGVGLAGCV